MPGLPSALRRGRMRAAAAGSSVLLAACAAAPVASAAPPASPNTGAVLATSGTPAPTGSGHTYYVDAVAGSDGANGLTPATAWRTHARVTSQAFVPGDVVAYKRGQTITGSATIAESGTATNPITVAAYGTGTPPVLENPGGWNMLVLDGAHLHVTQLEFQNGVVFDNADGQGISGPKYERSGAIAVTAAGTEAQIHDNEFTDVGVGVKTYGAGSDVHHNAFHDLRIAFRGFDSGSETSYGALGVSVNASDVVVAFNDFLNCRSTNSPYGADGGAIEIEGFASAKDDIDIHHNYARGNQGFLEVTETTSDDVRLFANLSDDYQQFIAWDTTTHPSNYQAVNNTIIRNRGSARALIDIYFYREAGPAPQPSWLQFRDNVVSTTSTPVYNGNEYQHSGNVFSGPLGSGVLLGAGDVIADPRFVNLAGGDFHLSATSPAWDSAAGTALSTTDLDGNPVPVGAARDAGAYERAAGTPGASIVSDGGFEAQTSIGSATTPWFSEGALGAGVDVAAGLAHGGADNGWLATTSSSAWGAVKQTVPVAANTTYRLTVWLQDSANFGAGYVGAKTAGGAVLGEVRFGRAPAYTRYVVTFNSGANTSVVLHTGFYGPGTSAWTRIDDVTLTTI